MRTDETKTRLLCLAASAPDELFFPDAATATNPAKQPAADDNDEVDMSARGGLLSHPLSPGRIYEGDADLRRELDTRADDSLTSEMMTEVLQDLEAPYRPNISSYAPPSTPSSSSSLRARQPESVRLAAASIDAVPAFRNLSVFSGEDERFAYARAVSRLYEMGSAAWATGAPHAPLSEAARSWERPVSRPVTSPRSASGAAATGSVGESRDVGADELEEEDERKLAGIKRRRKRGEKHDPTAEVDRAELEPPRISPAHVWGVIENWGARAGRWGRGATAYDDAEAGKGTGTGNGSGSGRKR
jgi:protein AFG1